MGKGKGPKFFPAHSSISEGKREKGHEGKLMPIILKKKPAQTIT
jgi:hypothetical protein